MILTYELRQQLKAAIDAHSRHQLKHPKKLRVWIPVRCTTTRKNGEACSNWAKAGSEFCFAHQTEDRRLPHGGLNAATATD